MTHKFVAESYNRFTRIDGPPVVMAVDKHTQPPVEVALILP
jgi:hypothetical protein